MATIEIFFIWFCGTACINFKAIFFLQKLNCHETDVRWAIKNGDPHDQLKIAYHLILDNKRMKLLGWYMNPVFLKCVILETFFCPYCECIVKSYKHAWSLKNVTEKLSKAQAVGVCFSYFKGVLKNS